MDTIKEIKLLTEQEASKYARQVLGLHKFFTDRGGWHTLGAAAYLDEPREYFETIAKTAKYMKDAFYGLYNDVFTALEKQIGVPVQYNELAAPPGFHIFRDVGDLEASVHIDTPFDRVEWPDEIRSPFSFTLALALPEKAGLNYGENLEFYEYKTGYMYLHDGLTVHQIAKPVPSTVEAPRITLQGHGAITSGKALVYF